MFESQGPRVQITRYTSIGSYPLFLMRATGEIYCYKCAATMPEKDKDIVDANWENIHLHCNRCKRRIESAYAEHLVKKGKHEQDFDDSDDSEDDCND